jgi:hypothetical protein
MWIFTETGFVSAVRKPYYPDKMVVRARDIQSLDDLVNLSGGNVITTKDSDYPHRVVVTDDVFKSWLEGTVEDLNYDNFKNRVALTRGTKFAKLLSGVWSTMLGAEDLDRAAKTVQNMKSPQSWWDEEEEYKAHHGFKHLFHSLKH